MGDQHHNSAALYHWIGGRVSSAKGLDAEVRGEILCQGSYFGHPVCRKTLYWGTPAYMDGGNKTKIQEGVKVLCGWENLWGCKEGRTAAIQRNRNTELVGIKSLSTLMSRYEFTCIIFLLRIY